MTSITRDIARLTLSVVGDFPVSQRRLWMAFADPRQLERFWGPPTAPATFTLYDLRVGGRAEYFLTLPDGGKWRGSWKFTAVNPISYFAARDGEDNAEDPNIPASMKFSFETTPTGSRMTSVTWFQSVEAMEHSAVGMEEGLRAAMPQLDVVLAEPAPSLGMPH
ncbi:MAG TPA: SRPBCC domain-containing protein [Polyangiaceae bacterium]|nr:SRPBCC domain-containing protein [Polyangiaceae bacterium]